MFLSTNYKFMRLKILLSQSIKVLLFHKIVLSLNAFYKLYVFILFRATYKGLLNLTLNIMNKKINLQ